MLFKKEITLRSWFEADKLFDKLEAAMMYDIKHPEKRKFRGRVDRANGTFIISQAIVENERDSLRPEITGFISEEGEQGYRLIKLKFRNNSGNRALLIMGLVIYVALFCVSLGIIAFTPEESDYYKWGIRGSFIVPPFTLFGFLIALYLFNMKSSEAIDDLSFIFGAREVHED